MVGTIFYGKVMPHECPSTTPLACVEVELFKQNLMCVYVQVYTFEATAQLKIEMSALLRVPRATCPDFTRARQSPPFPFM